MSYELLLAAFDDPDHAAAAGRAVRRLGVPPSQIGHHPADQGHAVPPAPDDAEPGFWSWLFGWDAEARRIRHHRRALSGRGAVVSVRVLPDEADRVRDLLDTFGPLSIDEPLILPPPTADVASGVSRSRR